MPYQSKIFKNMKNKNYYIILFSLIICIIGIGYAFDLNYKYWFGGAGILALYIWCKKDFTGIQWFGKPQPKPVKYNTPLSAMKEEEYNVEKNYPPVSEEEKEGYLMLTKLCVAKQRQNELTVFFRKLKDFSKDEDYMTTLNYVMEYLDEQEVHFIMSLDWKSDIETLEWRLKNSLKNNFGLSIDLPKPESFGTKASVSHDNVFEKYDKSLRNSGFQLGFIDTQSDEYVILIHKIMDREKIENAVNKIGYGYFDK